MKGENIYSAEATEAFVKNDPVVISDGKCRRATYMDINKGEDFYHVINDAVSIGETALLAGKDTVFYVEI